MVPSIFTRNTSVNGELTVPILNQKVNEAVPAGIVLVCPSVADSAAGIPPNHAHIFPVRGGAAPPPVPQLGTSHKGVPKLVDVCDQKILGIPPVSKPPSTIISL